MSWKRSYMRALFENKIKNSHTHFHKHFVFLRIETSEQISDFLSVLFFLTKLIPYENYRAQHKDSALLLNKI